MQSKAKTDTRPSPRVRGRVVLIAMFIGTCLSAQSPQSPRDTYAPGSVIRVAVRFEGPNAADFRTVEIRLDAIVTQVPPEQQGFATSITGTSGDSRPGEGSGGDFEISVRVPDNIASGDYKLSLIQGHTRQGTPQGVVTVVYNSPADFPNSVFHINNPRRFAKPRIRDLRVISRP